MKRFAILLGMMLPTVALGQAKQAGAPVTKDAKIRNAMSAAPASVSAQATIVDWPAKDGEEPGLLRAGTNGYTCFPDYPMTDGNDPMCVDKTWMDWMNAYMSKKPPKVTALGIGYMVAPGGASGSATDPYAEKPTSTNEWGFDSPHVMLLIPDTKTLSTLPTKRQPGAPWVMYAGTPYVHVMVPMTEGKKP